MKPVVIAAGGTGGHFFPAEALAGELARRGLRVALLTDARSGGLASPVFEGRECFTIRGSGIAGRGAVRAMGALAGIAAGIVQARGILARLRPAAIIGFGGYPSVAPVLAARLLGARPRVILHEQNGVLGRANRMLCRHADVLALSLEATTLVPAGMRRMVTGNPVRPAIAAIAASRYDAPHDSIHLLVLGGSLGARVFSDVVPPALDLLPASLRARLSVTQQCRAEDLERVGVAYAALGIRATLAPFFAAVAPLLQAAHLVLARAGASTVAELAVVGRPALLVPLPGAIDAHQRANADALVQAGGAWVLAQPDATPGALASRLVALLADAATLPRAAAAAAGLGRPDAASALADLVEQEITSATKQESRA